MTQGGLFDTPAPRAHGPARCAGCSVRRSTGPAHQAETRALAAEVAAEGRDTGLAEPEPGSVRVYIE
jgi:hypothetical protein